MTPDRALIAPEVAEALRDRACVVALESTLISHGMSYPRTSKSLRPRKRPSARAARSRPRSRSTTGASSWGLIAAITDGPFVQTNTALIVNDAGVAGHLAVALATIDLAG